MRCLRWLGHPIPLGQLPTRPPARFLQGSECAAPKGGQKMPKPIQSWDDVVDPLRTHAPGTRQTKVHLLGQEAKPSEPLFVKEVVETSGPEGLQTTEFAESRTCVNGHAFREGVNAAGVCVVCGGVLCSTQGCCFTCKYCGRAVCRRHARLLEDGSAYCTRCGWPTHLWRKFRGTA